MSKIENKPKTFPPFFFDGDHIVIAPSRYPREMKLSELRELLSEHEKKRAHKDLYAEPSEDA